MHIVEDIFKKDLRSHSFVLIYQEFTKTLLLSETYQRPIGDQHSRLETHLRLRHASSENDMPSGDRHACEDPSETNMSAEFNRNFNTYI